MELTKGKEAFDLLYSITSRKNSEEQGSAWKNLADIILNSDHKLLQKMCAEINPDFRDKLLAKPIWVSFKSEHHKLFLCRIGQTHIVHHLFRRGRHLA